MPVVQHLPSPQLSLLSVVQSTGHSPAQNGAVPDQKHTCLVFVSGLMVVMMGDPMSWKALRPWAEWPLSDSVIFACQPVVLLSPLPQLVLISPLPRCNGGVRIGKGDWLLTNVVIRCYSVRDEHFLQLYTDICHSSVSTLSSFVARRNVLEGDATAEAARRARRAKRMVMFRLSLMFESSDVGIFCLREVW